MPKQVLVPPLGTTVDTITLVEWLKQPGEAVTHGEPLFVIETDKANLDVEAPATGILTQVSAQPGDELTALTVIALIAEEGEAPKTPAPATASAPAAEPAEVQAPVAKPEPAAAVSSSAPICRERVFISPRARRLAEAHNVPIAGLVATGPEGAIIERDVRAWLEAHPASMPAAPAQTAVSARYTLQAEFDPAELLDWQDALRTSKRQPSILQVVLLTALRMLAAEPLNAPDGSELGLAMAELSDTGLRYRPLPLASALNMARLQKVLETEPQEAFSQGIALLDAGALGLDVLTPSDASVPMISIGRVRRGRPAWLSVSADPSALSALQAASWLARLVNLLDDPQQVLAI
ncbi:MAG: hypothetical protein GXY52_05650 [Chloroflexi bacterium]|nr:hypothetical protein [Chloroflexota bacterium]